MIAPEADASGAVRSGKKLETLRTKRAVPVRDGPTVIVENSRKTASFLHLPTSPGRVRLFSSPVISASSVKHDATVAQLRARLESRAPSLQDRRAVAEGQTLRVL